MKRRSDRPSLSNPQPSARHLSECPSLPGAPHQLSLPSISLARLRWKISFSWGATALACWLSLGKRDFCVSPVEIFMDHPVVILHNSEVDTTREGGSGGVYQL